MEKIGANRYNGEMKVFLSHARKDEELARKLASEDKYKIVLVDVRSHGYYDSGAARIKGSIRIEPNNLSEEIKTMPKEKDIYVYCT